jgi:hypothetical protein
LVSKPGISPVASIELIASKNESFLISASVIMKVAAWPFGPHTS